MSENGGFGRRRGGQDNETVRDARENPYFGLFFDKMYFTCIWVDLGCL